MARPTGEEDAQSPDDPVESADLAEAIAFADETLVAIGTSLGNSVPDKLGTDFFVWASLARVISSLDLMTEVAGAGRHLSNLGALLRPMAETWVAGMLVIHGGRRLLDRLILAEKAEAQRLAGEDPLLDVEESKVDIEVRFGPGAAERLPVRHRFDKLIAMVGNEDPALAGAAEVVYMDVIEYESYLSSHVLVSAIDEHIHVRPDGRFEISTVTRSGRELAPGRLLKASLIAITLAVAVARMTGADPTDIDALATRMPSVLATGDDV